MRTVPSLLLAAALLAGALAGAPAGAETLRLTIEEAVQVGLANSPAVKASQTALASAREDLKGTRAARYPTLSAGASWTHLFEQPEIPATVIPANTFGPGFPSSDVELSPGGYAAASDPVTFSADLRQTLFTFGRINNAVRLAREGLAQAALDVAEQKRKAVYQIRTAFYGYLLAREVAAINRDALQAKEEAYRVAQARYEAGQISSFEVLSAQSDLESFRSTVISSDNGVRTALLGVRNAIGLEEDERDLELAGELEPLEVSIDREELLRRAVEEKYDLAAMRKTMEILKIQADLARSQNRPTLGAWLNYQLKSGFDEETGKNEYFVADSWTGTWTAGVNLNVPISALAPWSKESADIRKAALAVEKLAHQYAGALSGVRLGVETAILKIAEQKAKIASGRTSVRLAQELYQSAVEQYDQGFISSMDLEDSQLRLNQARLGLAQAVHGYNTSILDLADRVGVSSLTVGE